MTESFALLAEDEAMQAPEEEQDNASPYLYPSLEGQTALSEDDEGFVVDWVVRQFKKFEKERKKEEALWDEAERVIAAVASKLDDEEGYSTVTFGKQTLNTLLGHFWQRSLQTPKLLFNLEGLTTESKETAPTYKAWLDRKLNKNRVRQKLDDANEQHFIPKGVVIGHVGVCEQKNNMFGLHRLPNGRPSIGRFIETEYTGADLTVIDPRRFVFDTESHANWDVCFKAHQTWMELEEIADSGLFSNLDDLEEESRETRKSSSGKHENVVGGGSRGKKAKEGTDDTGRIEVIEFHGAIRMPDGSYLRNWTAVVAKRKYLIRFEENPYFLNPYVKKCFEETDDGWGVSPIAYIFAHVNAASRLLNSSITAAELNMSPQFLAAKGMMPQKKIFSKKGQIIEYTPNTENPNIMPQPLQYRNEMAFPYLQLFEGQAEATTGATRQLSGNVTTNDKAQTATEFQGLQVVGNMVLDRAIDRYTLDFKLPLIERFAKIDAIKAAEMAQHGGYEAELIKVENWEGYEEYRQVTLDVMFGRYEFSVEDAKAEQERAANFKEDMTFIQLFMQTPEGRKLNLSNIFKRFVQARKIGKPNELMYDDVGYVEKMGRELAMENLIQMQGEVLTRRMMDEYYGAGAGTIGGGGAVGLPPGGASNGAQVNPMAGGDGRMENVVQFPPGLRQSGA